MADPGPLVGRGRAAAVYDIGGGRVLRRYHAGPIPDGLVEREAAVMRHVRAHGFPAPEVFAADGLDLVMERLDGRTMLQDLAAKPWRLRHHADAWADLHRLLAAVPIGGLGTELPARFGSPASVLHLDFHPDNIMLTEAGPVLFDWTNAAMGPAAADVALSWIIVATSTVDGSPWRRVVAEAFRGRLLGRFLDRCGRVEATAWLPTVAGYRLADRNVRPEEADRIRDLVADLTAGAGQRVPGDV